MKRFKFFHIQEKYIRFLHSGDNRVQFNKGKRRPYVGIVLSINEVQYFVPLESPKPSHVDIRSGGPVLKLDDGKLGIMGFNNMIPVPDEALIYFDFADIGDEKYKNLLYNQLDYCNRNKELIYRRAEITYQKTVKGKVPHYTKVCCDYRKLEKMCVNYDPNYKIKQKKNNK